MQRKEQICSKETIFTYKKRLYESFFVLIVLFVAHENYFKKGLEFEVDNIVILF